MRRFTLLLVLLAVGGFLTTDELFAAEETHLEETVHHAEDELHKAAEHAGEYVEAAHGHYDDHGKGHGMEKESTLFASKPWPYIWNLLMFLVLLGILTKFVWPPILQGLKAREEKQRSDLAQAEQAAKDATAKLAEYEAKLKEAHQEAQKIMEQTRAEADQLSARLKAEAEAQAQQLRDRTAGDIAAAKQEALASIYSQAASLSTQIAGQILQRELSPDDQAQLVEQSLNQIKASNN